MKINKALIIYKKSTYQIYVLEHGNPLFQGRRKVRAAGYLAHFKQSHDLHYRTLAAVRTVLRKAGIPFKAVYRARRFNPAGYDLIVCVGGDGTFLEAARRVRGQVLLGVNSDPVRSVGAFCAATGKTFGRELDRLTAGKSRITRLNRLSLRLNGRQVADPVLNDILICQRNPAAMSRYWVRVGHAREEQRSSGLWVASAAGSTGGIRSAGGRVLPLSSPLIQYYSREAYQGVRARYRIKGGVVPPGRRILIGSLMRDGMIYVDGAHVRIPFRYGDVLEVSRSACPLSVAGLRRKK